MKGKKRMETDNKFFNERGERLSAFALAVAATFLVFAAINAGFTPHATDLAARAASHQTLSL